MRTFRTERIAVFTFGVTFIAVLIALVMYEKNLGGTAYTFLRIVLALAAAGIGAAVPGFLDVQMKGMVRAGGAMAMFVIVFFFSPPPPVVIEDQPEANPAVGPEAAIKEWFSLIDAGAYAAAWEVSSEATKKQYEKSDVLRVFEAQRRPLGNIQQRVVNGIQPWRTLPNGTRGNFRLYTYRTKFTSGVEALEAVLVVAEKGAWRVLEHQIQLQAAGQR